MEKLKEWNSAKNITMSNEIIKAIERIDTKEDNLIIRMSKTAE